MKWADWLWGSPQGWVYAGASDSECWSPWRAPGRPNTPGRWTAPPCWCEAGSPQLSLKSGRTDPWALPSPSDEAVSGSASLLWKGRRSPCSGGGATPACSVAVRRWRGRQRRWWKPWRSALTGRWRGSPAGDRTCTAESRKTRELKEKVFKKIKKVHFTMMIPERRATAEATPILWASSSAAADRLVLSSSGVGTSCSTTEPVIRLTTAKVPERRRTSALEKGLRATTESDKDLQSYLWRRGGLCRNTCRGTPGRRRCRGQRWGPQTWAEQRPCLFRWTDTDC